MLPPRVVTQEKENLFNSVSDEISIRDWKPFVISRTGSCPAVDANEITIREKPLEGSDPSSLCK